MGGSVGRVCIGRLGSDADGVLGGCGWVLLEVVQSRVSLVLGEQASGGQWTTAEIYGAEGSIQDRSARCVGSGLRGGFPPGTGAPGCGAEGVDDLGGQRALRLVGVQRRGGWDVDQVYREDVAVLGDEQGAEVGQDTSGACPLTGRVPATTRRVRSSPVGNVRRSL